MSKRDYHEIIDIMSNNKFWIYGYGKAAKRLYRQVVKYGFEQNLSGFIVTDLSSVNERFCEKDVISIDLVDKNDWIIIAADTVSTEEIYSYLNEKKYNKIIRGVFSIIDLECGPPIEFGRKLPAKRFFVNNSLVSWVIAIYLAATKYINQDISGRDIYIRLVSRWLGKVTAEKDYYRFMDKVKLCELNGFSQDYPIKVCKDLYLIDGAHRVVLSQCFGDGNVLADVHSVTRGEWARITNTRAQDLDSEKVLLNYLTKDEIVVLKKVYNQFAKL